MKHVANVQDKEPDIDPRSIKGSSKKREKSVLRDTYYLIDPKESPSRRLTLRTYHHLSYRYDYRPYSSRHGRGILCCKRSGNNGSR
jgi:hypothetical protein